MVGAVLLGAYDASSRVDRVVTHAARTNTAPAASLNAAPDAASGDPTPTGAAPAAAALPSRSAETTAVAAPVVTISGCLEQANDDFRLTDTSGSDIPKSRSWKSGFLKKGATPVAIVDASKRLNLSRHVGERVSVTGTLAKREMQIRSLQRVAVSCDGSPKMKV